MWSQGRVKYRSSCRWLSLVVATLLLLLGVLSRVCRCHGLLLSFARQCVMNGISGWMAVTCVVGGFEW